eukprot:TRINITY_DN3692_c0_g1_i1.p1 TRINITY_DN3692_c0_g1~~TRINITY_DN3692_c0_g1_i1.p1  ORF type:complete len:454 (+),score=68.11 TRINITY_DN3692_c0_g1_i1:47-1408(+)
MQSERAQDVGIVAMDIYFPKTSVNQTQLESFEGVPKGKYTKGLGQLNMSFVGDREDIVSISLTVVQNFLEKYAIDPKQIGRLEVGTETLIDKSKSVKTYLMDLFARSGNFNIEGVDTVNACYGGTNALFNSINWMQSDSWDGRYALVVAADIAVYAKGPARPTGGCGAIAMLIGPNAPLVFESGVKGSHMEHVYDFYKPEHHVEYPTVDGKLSIKCYLKALDHCYDIYKERHQQAFGKEFNVSKADFMVFHSPYNGLVQKSVGRMVFNDFLLDPERPEFESVQSFKHQAREETYFNGALDKTFRKLAAGVYQEKVVPSIMLPQELGNLYSASLYAGLLSLLHTQGDSLVGKQIMMFSYGSGLAATMFSFRVKSSVSQIVKEVDLNRRLAQRIFVAPKDFHAALAIREERFTSRAWKPLDPKTTLFPGTFYLRAVDLKYRREYRRAPLSRPAKL